MHLMFTKSGKYEAAMPGFISVPFIFKVEELLKFLEENIHTHSLRTAEFIESHKQFDELTGFVTKELEIDQVEFLKSD